MYSKEITSAFLEKYKEFESIRDLDFKRFSHYQHMYPDLFELFRNIRNNLAHNTIDDQYPFIVSDNLLNEISLLVKEMQEKLIERAIHMRNLVYASLNSKVKEVIEIMHKTKFQYIPIIENDRIKYVFSSDVLLSYINEHDSIDNSLRMKDIIPYLDLEKFTILPLNTFTYQVVDLFKNKRIHVAFITKNGKDNEGILGMITSYEV